MVLEVEEEEEEEEEEVVEGASERKDISIKSTIRVEIFLFKSECVSSLRVGALIRTLIKPKTSHSRE